MARSANPDQRRPSVSIRSLIPQSRCSTSAGIRTAFPTHGVKHVVSQGIRAVINNNLSERLQGTFRDRDKTLILS